MGPSVTTATDLNMGYKIYSVDGNYTGSSNVSVAMVTHVHVALRSLVLGSPDGLTLTWDVESVSTVDTGHSYLCGL